MGYNTYSSRHGNVLSKQNPLSLDDEEVEKLMDVPNKGVKSLPRERVILARSQLGSQAIVQEGLSSNLSKDGNTKGNPRQLQSVARDI